MHLDSIVHFRKLEPKKRYRYTWVRFDRGKHHDLIDKKARVYDIGGNLLIVPFRDEFCTSESEIPLLSEIQILYSIKSEIEAHIGVQNLIPGNDEHMDKELQLDEELEREYNCDEKSLRMSGRSKPPSVPCGIQLRVKPGPGPDARTALF